MNEHTHHDVSVYVGLDVHKDSIDSALADAGRDGEVRHLGTVAGSSQPVATARAARLEQSMRDARPGWSLAPMVAALQAPRGVSRIAAITPVPEIQQFQRFANPRQLMAYLGLVPSEDSSGPRRRLGAITKACRFRMTS